MKPQIPWLRVFVEGVVIVGSILLAFGIEAWWDERQEREAEREVLSQLRAEYEANQTILAGTAAGHRLAVGAMEALVSASEGRASYSPAEVDSLFGEANITPHYNPSTGALTATISSGSISLVRNVELRNRLAGWDAVVSDLVLDEQTRRESVMHEVRPAMVEFGIAASRAGRSGSEADFVGTLASPSVSALLRSQIGYVGHLLTHYDDAELETDKMITALTEELAR